MAMSGSTAELDFSDLTGEDNGTDREDGISTQSEDICRVCRVGSLPGRPLFHPCVCTGSIRYIHQDCLVQWLKHSGKEFCELCMHRFEFVPIYRPDMPKRLPMSELMGGVVRGALNNIRHWLHLGFVAFVWLVIVPICIYRIYSFLLYGSLWSIGSFPLQLLSLENLLLDDVYGLLIVFVSLLGFISMVWLKDQLGNGGAPNWLARDQQEVDQLRHREVVDQAQQHVVAGQMAGGRGNDREEALDVLVESLATKMEELRALERRKYDDVLESLEARKRAIEVTSSGQQPLFVTPIQETTPTNSDNSSPFDPGSSGLSAVDSPDTGGESTSRGASEAVDQLQVINVRIQEIKRRQQQYQDIKEQFFAYVDQPDHVIDDEDDADKAADPLLDSQELGEEEKLIFIRIWELKVELLRRQFNEVEPHQEEEAQDQGRQHNRPPEEEPLAQANDAQAPDPPRPPRPNIVPALAGLARDQPIDGGANVGAQENVEELTWARLLGLDGSFRFLEHVLWLICLNSALIIAFVYMPYQLGYFIAAIFNLWDRLNIHTWRGVCCTLLGYIITIVFITAIYYCTGMLKLPRLKSVLGMAYVGIKVGMILAIEAGVFPLMCGWWIDICSFPLFGSTMNNRQASLSNAPGTVMFIHWLVGMVFIFYLASFVLLMREVVRPGVLWFLRNLNDQNFHPIHEMIGLPLQRHLKRFIMSCIMFGVCIVVVLLLPSRLVSFVMQGFLPYHLTLSSSFSPIREVQLELILLQFVIPTLLEHGNCRAGLKILITAWARLSARIFGLRSYLLDKHQTGGEVVDLHGNPITDAPLNPDPNGPVYTGPVQVLGPGFAPFKPYLRPPLFYLRVTGFLIFTLIMTILFCSASLVVPVSIGRLLMSLLGVTQAPELYTAAIGLYILWLVIRFGATVTSYIVQGTEILFAQMKLWSLQGVKCVVAGFLLFVVIPLLLGHLVDLLLISPLRVPSNRSPVFYPSTEWALGLLHTKCTCGAIWLTNVSFKAKLERLYQDGLRNLELGFVVKEVAWPVIVPLSLFITVPYVIFIGVLPRLDIVTGTTSLYIYRYFFPAILVLLLLIALIVLVVKQMKRLYTHIKNEKYLVGRQLVNYNIRTEQDTTDHAVSPDSI